VTVPTSTDAPTPPTSTTKPAPTTTGPSKTKPGSSKTKAPTTVLNGLAPARIDPGDADVLSSRLAVAPGQSPPTPKIIKSIDAMTKFLSAYPTPLSEGSYLEDEGFAIAVGDTVTASAGVTATTMLIQFRSQDGAQDFVTQQHSTYVIDENSDGITPFPMPEDPYSFVARHSKLDSSGKQWDVLEYLAGPIVIFMRVDSPPTSSWTRDMALMQSQINTLAA
jgi:hypothetical protein